MSMFFQKPSRNPAPDPPYHNLLEDIAAAKEALDNAYSNFENVVDPDLIDCYIFEMNAVHKRYKFLLKCAKQIDLL